MDRRTLSELELAKIQKAIAVKELTSAEILMEVYDHYVSHLESFEAAEFEEELFELEQKFNYNYCHALQAKFLKSSKKEIHQLQWSILKSYFTLPRIIGSISALVFLTILWTTLEGKVRGLAVAIPMLALLLVFIWILLKSRVKVNRIKRAIGNSSKIESSYLTTITLQFTLFIGLFNMFIHIPRLFDLEGFFESYYFILVSFALCLLYLGYTLSLIETWKIKSKTALI